NLRILLLIAAAFLFASCANVESVSQKNGAAETVNKSQEPNAAAIAENQSAASGHSHDVSDPHMKMTELREPKPGDKERAEAIAAKTRNAIEKYKDYRAALRDGFEILLPNVPQKMYHFNKLAYYAEAESQFNPEHPTSLLYEKTGNNYRFIGVMYTAPANYTEAELDERVPLSVTQWHQHINICLPKGANLLNGLIGQGDKFGLEGSIATKEQCEKEGGQFLPRLLGWMVHLYPYEQTTEAMWSVERQMSVSADSHHHGH
ncbi:MAG TPA: hypothetical protein VEQ34_05370, partial [Pyrinomonadaceae bacterium]|nr:hypothetical protein [Pyrinomonadaceae bacterium]